VSDSPIRDLTKQALRYQRSPSSYSLPPNLRSDLRSFKMSNQSSGQHSFPHQSRPPPMQPATRRRLPPASTNTLSRRPGPPGRMPTAPAAPATGRLRDISLASLLEGVDQVPSARKRLLPTPTAGVIATGATRPGVMQAKIPQRYTSLALPIS